MYWRPFIIKATQPSVMIMNTDQGKIVEESVMELSCEVSNPFERIDETKGSKLIMQVQNEDKTPDNEEGIAKLLRKEI